MWCGVWGWWGEVYAPSLWLSLRILCHSSVPTGGLLPRLGVMDETSLLGDASPPLGDVCVGLTLGSKSPKLPRSHVRSHKSGSVVYLAYLFLARSRLLPLHLASLEAVHSHPPSAPPETTAP